MRIFQGSSTTGLKMRNNHTTKKHDKSTVELNGSLNNARKKKNGEEICSFVTLATAVTDEILPIVVQQEENLP